MPVKFAAYQPLTYLSVLLSVNVPVYSYRCSTGASKVQLLLSYLEGAPNWLLTSDKVDKKRNKIYIGGLHSIELLKF